MIKETLSKFLKPTVWLIEDDKVSAEIVKRRITRMDNRIRIVHITTAIDFLQRVDQLKSKPSICPKVAIIDRMLPDINGVEVNVILKQACPCVKTVLYSGDITESLMEAEKKAFGFDKMIKKGTFSDTLPQYVSSCI